MKITHGGNMPVLVTRSAHVLEHTSRHDIPPIATFNLHHPSVENADTFEMRVFKYFIEVHFKGQIVGRGITVDVNRVTHLGICTSHLCDIADVNFSLYIMLFNDDLQPMPLGSILLSRNIDKETLADVIIELARYGTVGIGYLIINMSHSDLDNLLTTLEGKRICVRDNDRRDEHCMDAVELVNELIEKDSIFVHVVLNRSDYEAFRDFLPTYVPDYVAVIERRQISEKVCIADNACIEIPKNVKNILVGEKAIEKIEQLVKIGLVEKKDLDLALRVLKETGTSQSS